MTELTKRPKMDLAAHDYGTDAGAGYDNTQGGQDFTLPFLGLLQSNSPQVEADGPKQVVGAKAGHLYNTVTGDVYEDVEFVPALTEHCFVEWKPRTAGGGFVARHELDSPEVADAKAKATGFGKINLPNGNNLVETFYLYGALLPPNGEPEPAVIGFSSTKIGPYKRLMTRLNMFTVPTASGGKGRPPLFAHLLKVGNVAQENEKGKFKNFCIVPAKGSITDSLLAPTDARFLAAKAIRDIVLKGGAKVDYQASEDEGEDPSKRKAF